MSLPTPPCTPCPPERPLLIGALHCPYVQRCRILMAALHVDHRFVTVDLSALPTWVLELNPAARVPIWLDDAGVLLESSVINEFLRESAGNMPGVRQRARVRMAIAAIDRALGAQHHWAEQVNRASGRTGPGSNDLGGTGELDDVIEIAWARAETALEQLAPQLDGLETDAWLDAPLATLLWRHHHLLRAARIARIEPIGDPLPSALANAWDRLRKWPAAQAIMSSGFPRDWARSFGHPAQPFATALATLDHAE